MFKMNAYAKLGFVTAVAVIMLSAIISPASADLLTSNWKGAASAPWWNPDNWDNGLIPFNDVWDEYIAHITNTSVVYNCPVKNYPISLYGLLLDTDGALYLYPGSDITITDMATLNGSIIADKSLFTALPGGDFVSTSSRLAFGLSNGARVTVPIVSWSVAGQTQNYNWDGSQYNHDLTTVSDPGSWLDLSAVTYFDAAYNDYNGNRNVKFIRALNGGTLDLSGVMTVRGPQRGEDRLDFTTDQNSTIDFSSLRQVINPWGGHIRFDFDQAAWSLPALELADYADFVTSPASQLDLPLLQTHNYGYFGLSQNSTVNAPVLQNLYGGTMMVDNGAILNLPSLKKFDSVTFDLRDGGTINAAQVTELAGSSLSLTPTRSINTGVLTSIKGSVFGLSQGAQWGTSYGDLSAATIDTTTLNQSINWDGSAHNRDVFYVTDAGSRLDLSSATLFNGAYDDGYYYYRMNQRFKALKGGVIDLSGLTKIIAPSRSEDYLMFQIDPDANIIMSALKTIESLYGGRTYFGVSRANWSLDNLLTAAYADFVLSNGVTVDLPLMHTANYTSFTLGEDARLNAPALTSLSSGMTLSVGKNSVLDLPLLTGLVSSSLTFTDNGSINAPALTTLNNITLDLNPTRSFTCGNVSSIDNMIFFVSGGLQWGALNGQVSAASYTASSITQNYNWDGSQYNRDMFVASGAGSLLDLSTVTSMSAAFNDQNGNRNVLKARAVAGGVLDLSGLKSIESPARGEDRLDFILDKDSLINLSSLETITNPWGARVRFDVSRPAWSLNSLKEAPNTDFILAEGVTLDLPSLVSWTNGQATLGRNARLNAEHATQVQGSFTLDMDSYLNLPAATRLNSFSYTAADRAVINAPLVTELTGSYLTITPLQQLITSPLRYFDNTRIVVNGGQHWGAAYGNLAATSYSSTGHNSLINWDGYTHNNYIFDVSGQNTILDLSGITSFNTGFWTNPNYGYRNCHHYQVTAGATLDMSDVVVLTTPAYGQDFIYLTVDNATLDLSGLQEIRSASSGRVRLRNNEGSVTLGGIFATPYLDMSIQGGNGRIEILRDWIASASSSVTSAITTGLPLISLAGNYTFAHKDENYVHLENARLNMNGLVTAAPAPAPAANTPAGDLLREMTGLPEAQLADGVTGPMATYYQMLASDEFAAAADDFLELVRSNRVQAGMTVYPMMQTADVFAPDPNDPVLGIQYMEVGSLDGGLTGTLTNNFVIGQLIVGQSNQPAVVYLTDLIDNGNRGTAGKECLYLAGIGDADGLRILGGSTLVIQGINVYAKMSGQMVHVNGLFTGGNAIAWDQGFISIDPVFGACGNLNHPYAAADISLDCKTNIEDYAGICAQWLASPCLSPDWCGGADLNHDGQVDSLDLGIMTENWLQ